MEFGGAFHFVMWKCEQICMHIYTHIYTCIYIYILWLHTKGNVCICIYTSSCMSQKCACISTELRDFHYIYTEVCINTYICIRNNVSYIYTYIYIIYIVHIPCSAYIYDYNKHQADGKCVYFDSAQWNKFYTWIYIYIYTYNNLNEKVDLGAGAEWEQTCIYIIYTLINFSDACYI